MSAAETLLGRSRAPFLPDQVWAWSDTAKDDVLIDRRNDPLAWQAAADADMVLVTQWNDGRVDVPAWLPTCSASMPRTVRDMLGALDLRAGQRVLEIGTGTGYTAALLKDRVGPGGSVVTVEVDPVLAADARGRLSAAGLDVDVIAGDGFDLDAAALGAFDRDHVTCGVRRIPASWLRLCPRGRIVMPFGVAFDDPHDRLLVLDVADGQASGRFGGELAFMMARHQRLAHWEWPDTGEAADVDLGLTWEDVDFALHAPHTFALGLMLQGATFRVSEVTAGEPVVWLVLDDSAASIGFADGRSSSVAGDLGLANRFAGAVRWWLGQGRPEPGVLGLTVGAGSERYCRQAARVRPPT